MIQQPDDLSGPDGFGTNWYAEDPEPEPDPTPLHPYVTRSIIAFFGLLSGLCAWNTSDWIRHTGIAFAVLFLCAAILPARRQRT